MQHFNPYHILGIEKTASDAEIHKAYRKLALIYHPDKHAGKSIEAVQEAEVRFKQIVSAYEMLTNKNAKHSEHQTDDENMLTFGPDQLTYNSSLPLENRKNHFNKFFDFSEKGDFDYGSFKKSIYGDICKPLSSYNKTYNTSHLDNLSEDDIRNRLSIAKMKYSNIDVQVNGKAFIWIAEKEGCAPIYLFSTMHDCIDINNSLDDRFGDVVENIIDKVDVVFTEVEQESARNESKKLLDLINKFLNNTTDTDESDKVDYTSMDTFIQFKSQQQNKELRPLENDLVRNLAEVFDLSPLITEIIKNINTKIMNKYVKSLESHEKTDIYSEQYFNNIAPSTSFPLSKIHDENDVIEFCETLNYSLDNHEDFIFPNELLDVELNKKLNNVFSTASRNEKISAIKEHLNASLYYLMHRNFFWMESILLTSSVEKKSALIADGAAHNLGQFGLPNLLAFEGYTLKPIMQYAPTSKKAIIRDLVFSQGVSLFKPVKVSDTVKNEILSTEKTNTLTTTKTMQ